MQERPANSVLVIDKAARLLDQFRGADTLTLAELSDRLKMSKSTVHRLLASLEQTGFIEKEPQPGCYRLGLRLFELGSLVQGRMHLRQIALRYMSDLVQRTGETAFLIILDGLQGLCIERVEGTHVQALALKLGGTLPLHVGAGPRCLLAYSPPELFEKVVASNHLRRFTPNTIATREALRADGEKIRRQGYVLSYEDVTIGVAALGMPLFNYTGKIVGALSLSGITPRWTDAHIAEMLTELRPMAEQISARMGWKEPGDGSDPATAGTEVGKRAASENGTGKRRGP